MKQRYPGMWTIKSASPPANDPNGTPVSRDYSFPAVGSADYRPDGTRGGIYAGCGPFGGAGSVAFQGTLKVKLRYVRNTIRSSGGTYKPDPNDKPRGKTYLEVTATGDAFAQDGAGRGDVRNPSKERASISITPAGGGTVLPNQSYDGRYTTNQTEVGQSRTFLVPVDSQGALTQTVSMATFNAKVELLGNRSTPINNGGYGPSKQWNRGSAYMFINFTVGVRDFSVGLTRLGAPAAKGEEDATLDKTRDEWVDKDGNGHGHTIYSYNYETITAPAIRRSYYNWQTFQGSKGSSWAATTNEWSPSDANDTETQHQQDMPFGTPEAVVAANNGPGMHYVWRGTPTGTQQKIITYTVSGVAGLTESKTYNLTLHDSWEVVSDTISHPQVNYRPHPYGSWVQASHDGDTVTGQLDQSYGWDVGVTFTGQGDIIADLVGVDVSVSRTASTSVGVGNEHNNVRAGYRCRVMIWDAVIRHSGTANQWDASGYVGSGPQPYQIDEPDDPAGGMELGLLEWGGPGPEPSGGPFYYPPNP